MRASSKASTLIFQDRIDSFHARTILNRVVLFPTPQEGSRLQQRLAYYIKALLKADMENENG